MMGFPGKWLRYTVGLRPPGLRTCLLMPPTVAMICAAQSGVSCRLIGKLEESTMIPSKWCGWVIVVCTSSTAQGGGGSFKNRKPIGEVGCCESGMAERSH